MDFSNRGSQQSPAASHSSSSFQPESAPKSSKHTNKTKAGWPVIGGVILLVAIAVMILAVIGTLMVSGGKAEKTYVDSNKLQAVFLTNDQVYFGKINQLNGKYLVLSDIYYLRSQSSSTTSTTTSNSNVSLVKLGCELHKPYDQMVINRDQVQFWENLQANGQVAEAVASYAKSNPNNTCSNSASNSASGSSVQGSGSTSNSNSTSTNSSTTNP